MSWDTWTSTAAAPNCSSRYSPSEKAVRRSDRLERPFCGCTKTFTDPRLCAAIVDRLTFAGQIIETGTTSYRLACARTRRAAS